MIMDHRTGYVRLSLRNKSIHGDGAVGAIAVPSILQLRGFTMNCSVD